MDVPNKKIERWVEGFKSISIFLDHHPCPPPFYLHYLPPFNLCHLRGAGEQRRSKGSGRASSPPPESSTWLGETPAQGWGAGGAQGGQRGGGGAAPLFTGAGMGSSLTPALQAGESRAFEGLTPPVGAGSAVPV